MSVEATDRGQRLSHPLHCFLQGRLVASLMSVVAEYLGGNTKELLRPILAWTYCKHSFSVQGNDLIVECYLVLLCFSKQTAFVLPWFLDREGDAYLSKVFIDPIILGPDILCVYPCTAYWLLGIVVFPLCRVRGEGKVNVDCLMASSMRSLRCNNSPAFPRAL